MYFVSLRKSTWSKLFFFFFLLRLSIVWFPHSQWLFLIHYTMRNAILLLTPMRPHKGGEGEARTNASLFVSGLTVNRYATLNEAGCWKDVSLDALRCMGVTSGLRNADEISAGASRTGKEETSSSNANSLQKHTQDASHLNNVYKRATVCTHQVNVR